MLWLERPIERGTKEVARGACWCNNRRDNTTGNRCTVGGYRSGNFGLAADSPLESAIHQPGRNES
jgi:hypothetical protein